jgi:hypothetical protein
MKTPNSNKITFNSGGAEGSDTYWEMMAEIYGMKINAFSYKTKKHKSINKKEISEEDYEEGIIEIKRANKHLKRKNIDKYMNLLARNWAQVKYSNEIFAIGNILKKGETSKKGYKASNESVDGGTGYAIQMGILNNKTIYVFDQDKEQWFKWSYIIETFIKIKDPIILEKNIAGIGTRELKSSGKKAIENLFLNSFNEK